MVTLIRYYNNLNDRALADYQVKREVGLVIPGYYNARTSREKIVGILRQRSRSLKSAILTLNWKLSKTELAHRC